MANPELLARIQSTLPNPDLDIPTAIQRYLDGESMQVLAKEWQISPQGAYKRFKRYALSYTGAEYADLITQALVDRVAEADERLDNAPDAVEIARAREIARFARMDLERRRPKLYGQKQEVVTDNTIRVIIDDRTPLVIPHIDMKPAIISHVSEVIDNRETDEE